MKAKILRIIFLKMRLVLTLTDTFKDGQLVTGGCCQWRGSPSYDSDEHVGIVVLRRKFSDEPPNSTPPGVMGNTKKRDRIQINY